MSHVGQKERITQNHTVKFFQNELGYRYIGDWQDREGKKLYNANMNVYSLLRNCLGRAARVA